MLRFVAAGCSTIEGPSAGTAPGAVDDTRDGAVDGTVEGAAEGAGERFAGCSQGSSSRHRTVGAGTGRPAADPAGLLGRLRGDGHRRPEVDPGLAGGLREWLEDELAGAIAALPAHLPPLRITKADLVQVTMCEASAAARRAPAPTLTVELVRGVLVDMVFRQWVTTGQLGDPVRDALAGIQASGDPDGVASFVAALSATERRQLGAEVKAHAAVVAATWPPLSPAWLPRTQERLLVPLGGGRVVLSGVADLVLGAPAAERATVGIVEVKSGERRVEHRADLHFVALLETVRSGAPPFRVATYYTQTGELDVESVTEELLIGALQRVLAAARRLCRLAAGDAPSRTPNPLCRWCPALSGCLPGRRHVREQRAAHGGPGDGEGAGSGQDPHMTHGAGLRRGAGGELR